MDPWNMEETNSNTEMLVAVDLMYLTYTMARIRPVVPDIFVVQRLKDMKKIKALEMDVVLLQFWLAGLTGLAESTTLSQRLIWKSLVSVKIPYIVSQFGLPQGEICSLVESALRQLSFYRGILNECDQSIAGDSTVEQLDVLRAIAVGCITKGLIRPNQLHVPHGLTSFQDTSDDYCAINHSSLDLIDDLCGRTLSDFVHQEKLVNRIIQVCRDAGFRNDVPVLSRLCQTLDDNPLVLDLIHFLQPPSALLVPLEGFVNNFQHSLGDDIDTCNSNLEGLGTVLILIMTIIRRYELASCLNSIFKEKQGFCYLWLHRTSAVIPATSMSSMSADMHSLMGRWVSALFDSMGISDDLIQTSKPQMLLEISPSIFAQSLAACQAGVIDITTLNSGLDYFLQPCLLFVLVGVVQFLCQEILFSSSVSSPDSTKAHLPSAQPASGLIHAHSSNMLSPTGHIVSPLAAKGIRPVHHSSQSNTMHSHGNGKTVAAVAMLQTILKSLLTGEAFPTRLMRLLKSEIQAALEHQTVDNNDRQMAIIQERLAAASLNYYPWSVSGTYDVPKLAQQTSLAFEAIALGGRTSIVTRKEKGWPVFGESCYHIDVDLFRATLCHLGPAQFATTILKQLLKTAMTPNGKRAVELGAAMMTTPLIGCGDQHLAPQSLVWTLMYRTLWIPVPGRLETFSQGRLLAAFVGMTLDFFQSHNLIQLREKQQRRRQQRQDANSLVEMSSFQGEASKTKYKDHTLEQLERDTAVEYYRVMLDQRLHELKPVAKDRPGFEGFAQGMALYKECHQSMSLPLHQSRKVRR
ncbi:mediator complex subunit Med5-domain-containing protein [Lobosporangium transversale]|uniref:Mediator of RNA polymerase II transcription subunit 5 n=1 Tax=Lobosporangium transversale TaxID=64571 RepID=A0A1Y2GK36_9FUNG|nr:mediator complex subunit Med5-domain-containing protein [Lobosporangium transversale]ORZ13369.1 mediator complex subunit Med5-domain-containing protein [Lobosporangium transversale]|eukprot:XP_021880450.1 mediator complex subunit Med5-domain-containing protein [Lobosporangium transversale]